MVDVFYLVALIGIESRVIDVEQRKLRPPRKTWLAQVPTHVLRATTST